MLTEPPPTRLPFRNGPTGASVQHLFSSILGFDRYAVTVVMRPFSFWFNRTDRSNVIAIRRPCYFKPYLFLGIELKVDPACAASTPVDGSSAYAYRFEGVHQFRFTQPNLDS